jgi:hypothetical protein
MAFAAERSRQTGVPVALEEMTRKTPA